MKAGWYLVEINDSSENTFIGGILDDNLSGLASDEEFNYQDNSLTFLNDDTIASDGGGAAYVWTGGTDSGTEGSWLWDNSNILIETSRAEWGSGAAGSEPDNFNGNQDHLAFGLQRWPADSNTESAIGEYGEWNDLNEGNLLFSLVEFDYTVNESTGIPLSSSGISYVEGYVYRLRNDLTGKFIFSTNSGEIDIITGQGWVNEGAAYASPTNGTTDLHRFLMSNGGHFYTANAEEKNILSQDSSFTYEGVAYQVYGTAEPPQGSTPVVRYLSNTGSHLYSTSQLAVSYTHLTLPTNREV